jgi:uncharacterized membrane protein
MQKTEQGILAVDQERLRELAREFVGEPNINPTERVLSVLGIPIAVTLGVRRGGILGTVMGLAAAELAVRGLTGHSPLYRALGIDTSVQAGDLDEQGIWIGKIITVSRPVGELYSFWRNLSNLPRFIEYLHSVTETGGSRTHWVAKGPLGLRLEWDAEIVEATPNQEITWRSVPGSGLVNAGHIRFQPLPNEQGTEVSVVLGYLPPAGPLGDRIAEAVGMSADALLAEALDSFKQLMETGEAPHKKKSPQGGDKDALPLPEARRLDIERRADTVQTASEDSFPASDPPASW